MTRQQLRQYNALKREVAELDARIDKLRERIAKLPDISDKVQATSAEWPYIQVHIPVKAKPPKEVAHLNALIDVYVKRHDKAQALILDIERYIDGIADSETRQIFEMVFIDGLTYREVGDDIGMDYSTVAKRIAKKLSTNSTK